MTKDLDQAALDALLAGNWKMVEGRDAITRRYQFANFVEAFGWMTRAALHAEKLDHHPEWSNVYRNVEVTLTTHDLGGLGPKDIALAVTMDKLAGESS